MASLLDYSPRQRFALRIYGRRWLMAARMHTGPTIALGWRALTWTSNLDEAEKWFTRMAAERFAATLRCPCEIVPVERPSEMTPEHA